MAANRLIYWWDYLSWLSKKDMVENSWSHILQQTISYFILLNSMIYLFTEESDISLMNKSSYLLEQKSLIVWYSFWWVQCIHFKNSKCIFYLLMLSLVTSVVLYSWSHAHHKYDHKVIKIQVFSFCCNHINFIILCIEVSLFSGPVNFLCNRYVYINRTLVPWELWAMYHKISLALTY